MKQPSGHHLAQLNWGRLRYDWDDPRTAPFRDALDSVYAVAERNPGYLWRLNEDAMEAEQQALGGAFGADPYMASTLSVWRDAASFADFTLRSVHGRFMARAGEWFRDGESGLVLWWQPADQTPSVADGLTRYSRMRRDGEGPEGFSWASLNIERGTNPRHATG